MNYQNRMLPARAMSEEDISAQFEGMDVVFDDKVTLFPVQVEKTSTTRRKRISSTRR